ncbi:MAG TPA: hypothetical protein DCS67_00175 [Clostridiales bacterium UBA8960]|nr:hypothetical protein [Clostridiales bacterium UBA8960]
MFKDYYSEFIEKTAYMILLIDEDGNIYHANESFQKIIGCQFEASSNHSIWQFINPYSKQLCKTEFSNARHGDRFELVMVLTRSDGSYVYTDGKFNCSYDDVSGQKMITCILQDVTELNEREIEFNNLKLQLDEKTRYWKLLHKTYVALINEQMEHFDDNMVKALEQFGKMVYADRAFIFEYDMDQLLLHNTYEWCDTDIVPKCKNMQNVPFSLEDSWIQNHISGLPVYIENVSDLPDEDYVKTVLKPYGVKSMVTYPMISDGVLYGSVGFDSVKISRSNADVEKQMLSELSALFLNAIHRKRMHDQLIERQLRFNGYINEAPIGIFVCGTDFKFHEVNKAFCKLTGYSAQELVNESLTMLFDQADLERTKLKFLSSEEVYTVKFDYVGRRKDGTPFKALIASATVGEFEIISFCYDPLEI